MHRLDSMEKSTENRLLWGWLRRGIHLLHLIFCMLVIIFHQTFLLTDNVRYFLLLVQAFWSELMPPMQSIVESPKSKPFSAGLLYEDLWVPGLLQSNQ
jgi:hypothetical protein